MKTIKISMAMAIVCLLFSCGGGLNGVYKSGNSEYDTELRFISASKVQVGSSGDMQEYEYEKKGKEVKINIRGTVEVITIDDEGCLHGSGLKFCKAD